MGRHGTWVPRFPGPRKVTKVHPAVWGPVALALVQQATEGGVPGCSDSGHKPIETDKLTDRWFMDDKPVPERICDFYVQRLT